MKTFRIASVALLFITNTLPMCGQGTFVYDQQSVTNDAKGGEGAPVIQSNQPIGQSFTPTLTSVGFIRLFLGDTAFNGLGATIYVNLRADSITGSILGSTDPVFMGDGFVGRTNFLFATPVTVSPSTTYFFQPVVQSGDLWGIVDDPNYNYPGGTAFGGGQPAPPFDLWFREGIIVPEPSSVALALSGLACFAVVIGRRRNRYLFHRLLAIMPSNALQALLLCLPICALAQGTFVYDQQSVTNDSTGGEGVPTIQLSQPVGQSFTPTLSSVGFVRFFLIDTAFNGLGATVIVNVRSDSITGPILGSTDPVFMPDGFGGRTNFVFSTPVALTPSSTYFLEPVVQSGDLWGMVDDPNYNYPGGTAFGGGQPTPPFDLWFREGIIVPEPSSLALALSGLSCFAVLIRRRRNR